MMKNRKIFIFTAFIAFCLMFAALSGCKGCGKDKNHEHVYGEPVVVKEATCTDDGTVTRKCEKCDKTEVGTIPKLGHDLGELIAGTEKTCESDGTLPYYECKRCDTKFDVTKTTVITDTTIKKGHTINFVKAAEPATCLQSGNYAYSFCSACNKYLDADGNELKEIVIPKLDHDFTDGHCEQVEVTCDTDGNIEYYKCKLCGKYYIKNGEDGYIERLPADVFIPKTNHPNKTYVTATASSCLGDGSTGEKAHYHCEDCGKNFDERGNELSAGEVIIPVKHETEYVAGLQKTCTEDGKKAHYHCLVCGRDYSDEAATELAEDLTLSATGHSFIKDGSPDTSELIPAKAATETENGCIAHYHCDNCGKNFDEAGKEIDNVILIYSHNLVWIDETPADCKEMIEGRKAHYECSDADCYKYFDATGKEVSLDSLAIPVTHVFGELVKANEGDCEHREVKEDYYKCGVCELYYDKSGERLADIDLFGDYGDHKLTYVYCDEYRHNEVCSVCGTFTANDVHGGKTEYYVNASGIHVKRVKCSYCGYVSGEQVYFAAEDAIVAPVVVGKGKLEWTRIIFFANGGRDILYKDIYEFLTDEELDSLKEFMNAFIADADKVTTMKEMTIVYEDFTKTLDLCFIKPGYELNKVYTKEKKYDVASIESLEDVDYVMYTINGERYIYSYNVTISDEDKQKFVQAKAMLEADGGERLLNYYIVEGSGDYAVTYRIGITLTSEPPVYVTDFSVEDEVLAGSRPKITAVFYSNNPYIGEGPDGDVYCDEYYFSDFNKPGKYYTAFKYEGILITGYVTVRGNNEIRSLEISGYYMDVGEEIYLVVNYYGGDKKIVLLTPDMVTQGNFDPNVAGIYNDLVISYEGAIVNVWRIEVKDDNDRSPSSIYMSDNRFLWKAGKDGYVIPDLTGIELRVYLKNSDSYYINVTEDMLFYDKEAAKTAFENDEDFTVTVKYLGLECTFTVSKNAEDASDINYINVDLHFENNELGERYIEITTKDYKKYYVLLTADMIYNAEENPDGEFVKTTPFNLSSAKKGIYDVIIVYNGYESVETAWVYSSSDIEAFIACSADGYYTVGTKESVLEAISKIVMAYYSYVDFDGEIESLEDDDEINLSSAFVAVPYGTDFGKPGKITVTVSYKNAVTDFEIELIPDLKSVKSETYIIYESAYDIEKIVVYENGYMLIGGEYIKGFIDKENDIFGTCKDYDLYSVYSYYKLDRKTNILEAFRASSLGMFKKSLYLTDGNDKVRYDFYDVGGKYYVDKFAVQKDTEEYRKTYYAEFSSDGKRVNIFGEEVFAITGENLGYFMEGITVYKYVVSEKDGISSVIYFNDNGKAYGVNVTVNSDGTVTEAPQKGALQWVKKDKEVKIVISGIDFMKFEIVTENGSEKLVLKYSLMS